MLKNLDTKYEKSENETKLKDIVITNTNNTFEIPVLKTRGRLPNIGYNQ